MVSFINSQGEVIKFASIKEFADRFGFSHSVARSLHCGSRVRLKGFCSTSSKAKARKYRKRFLTKLVNTKTGEECILGPSIKAWAEKRHLCPNEVWKLINSHHGKLIYRDWCLQQTREAADGPLTDGFQ